MSEPTECSFCGEELSAEALREYSIKCEEWTAKRAAIIAEPGTSDHYVTGPLPTCDACLADIAANQLEAKKFTDDVARLHRRVTRAAIVVVFGGLLLIALWAWWNS